MSRIVPNLLGRGIRYPFSPNSNKGVELNEWIDRVNQSLFIILSTTKGSRLFNPEWGSNISKYRFDPFDNILLDKLEATIKEDITMWEPRVVIDNIEFNVDSSNIDNHVLYITLTYYIINTDIEGNFVFPYRLGSTPTYIKE